MDACTRTHIHTNTHTYTYTQTHIQTALFVQKISKNKEIMLNDVYCQDHTGAVAWRQSAHFVTGTPGFESG